MNHLLIWKKTNHYVNCSFHCPLHQKLGVINILLDRIDNTIPEPGDRGKEVEPILKAYTTMGIHVEPYTTRKNTERRIIRLYNF